jgi:hypothetical protein
MQAAPISLKPELDNIINWPENLDPEARSTPRKLPIADATTAATNTRFKGHLPGALLTSYLTSYSNTSTTPRSLQSIPHHNLLLLQPLEPPETLTSSAADAH